MLSVRNLINRVATIARHTLYSSRNESFLNGPSGQYIEEMYNLWLQNPANVPSSWHTYFTQVTQMTEAQSPVQPTAKPISKPVQPTASPISKPDRVAPPQSVEEKTIGDHLAVQGIIIGFQSRGHTIARLDPLEIQTITEEKIGDNLSAPPGIVKDRYILQDLNKVYNLPSSTFIGGHENRLPLKEILKRLQFAYTRHIGAEFVYIDSLEQRNFIRQRLETPGAMEMTKEDKVRLLKRLTRTSELENFLAKKWPSVKRFGVEGCEMLIPAVKHIIDKSSALGVDHFVIGIAHRGRLNLLANVCRKPLYQIFTQFDGIEIADDGSGDVKYHLGSHTERVNRVTKKHIKMSVPANPSHLESINPGVLGRVRAAQFYRGDHEGKTTLAIVIHGDAAFAAEGVVYESIGLSALPCYTTHGCINLVINNQIGFTTDPRFSRSSRYCSDVGRVVDAPIFHVNADQPESVIHVCSIAAEYRAKFKKDVVVDIVGYRKYGHNEVDEPMFTQPLMYTKIRKMKPVLEKYSEQLVKEGVVTQEGVKEIKEKYLKICEDEYSKASMETKMMNKDWLASPWSGFFKGKDPLKVTPTGVNEDTLANIGKKFSSPPPPQRDFVIHKGIERILNQRMSMVNNRQVDWALGEAMAIGSLVKEGIHVRLSGQDVERGTFSQRHHVLHHQTIDKTVYQPLSDLYPDQAPYLVCNSSISEFGVLGFEAGYSLANPNSLVMWEAQFGDFSNNGQCVFDQYLSAGQAKWVRQSGLVVLLPHGYEGMGPEHSSARPERFLQMCDDDPDVIPDLGMDFAIKQLRDCNWIVANCSTPANYFHILRRQVAFAFRKPLILFTPKSLLRHPDCKSSFDEMVEGTEFQRTIPEKGEASQNSEIVKKLIFCTGKVYYDAAKERADKNLHKEIAISRIEQLFPFPYDLIKKECENFPNAKICWVQEEHKNGGAYAYFLPRMQTLLKKSRDIHYIGRPPAASPATGNKLQHTKEVQNLLQDITAL